MTTADSSSALDEGALLRAVLDRDERAWRELVRRYDATLRAMIRETAEPIFALAETDVEDVLGDFWLYLLEDDLRLLRAFDPSRHDRLLAWLKLLVSQLTHKHARALRRRSENESDHVQVTAPTKQPSIASDRLLTPQEVADRLKVSRKQAYRLIRAYMAPCSIGARTLRVTAAQVEAFIQRRTRPTPNALSPSGRSSVRRVTSAKIASGVQFQSKRVQPKLPRTRPKEAGAAGNP
jgi:hypothetical protein